MDSPLLCIIHSSPPADLISAVFYTNIYLTKPHESELSIITWLVDESLENITPPFHTRRLIPMKYIPAEEVDESLDEQAWSKKLHGPDIIVVSTFGLPHGWILVEGDSSFSHDSNRRSESSTLEEKRACNPYDRDDPNNCINGPRKASH